CGANARTKLRNTEGYEVRSLLTPTPPVLQVDCLFRHTESNAARAHCQWERRLFSDPIYRDFARLPTFYREDLPILARAELPALLAAEFERFMENFHGLRRVLLRDHKRQVQLR